MGAPELIEWPIQLPKRGAVFNLPPEAREPGETRRWWLGRWVGDEDGLPPGIEGRRILFIGVQPSTADETDNDPTILREIGFSQRWGYSWLDKVNLFDLCSPNPETLYSAAHLAVMAVNDDYIRHAAARADFVMCVWGNHGAHLARGARVKRMLRDAGIKLHIFGTTKEGYPKHTLARGKHRIPDDARPIEWT
jgi:hypothetical protein